MTTSAVIACLWVLAATITALLPMRRQYVPGVALLIAAPVLIGALVWDYGWIVGGLATLGFVSMFRNPLRYLLARARGENPQVPR